jgi:hypothetical protein
LTCELDREVTRETIVRLHDDGLRAIRSQVLQHLSKACVLIDGVRATHGRVVILPNDGEARSPGESTNGCSLAFVAVLVRPDIGGT